MRQWFSVAMELGNSYQSANSVARKAVQVLCLPLSILFQHVFLIISGRNYQLRETRLLYF